MNKGNSDKGTLTTEDSWDGLSRLSYLHIL
jgi:hypothetical protein